MAGRANNLGRLLDDLTVRDMAYSDIQQFLELGPTATNEYVKILKRAQMVDMVKRNAAGREVYRLTKDAAKVKAFRDRINACQRRPNRPSTNTFSYVAATIDLMGRIERYIAKNPSTLAAPIFAELDISKARGNKTMAYMRRDGVIQHVPDTRPTQWMIGADPALGIVNDGRVASRKSVAQWRAETVIDPLALSAAFFKPPHDAEPVEREAEPRQVALTGFAALAGVRFEMPRAVPA